MSRTPTFGVPVIVGAVTGAPGLGSDDVANTLKDGWAEALKANF